MNLIMKSDNSKENEMTDEEQQLLIDYQEEIEKCFSIAQKLDALYPKLPCAFTGTPSERIKRHLYLHGILK
jgi:hypothetical protein